MCVFVLRTCSLYVVTLCLVSPLPSSKKGIFALFSLSLFAGALLGLFSFLHLVLVLIAVFLRLCIPNQSTPPCPPIHDDPLNPIIPLPYETCAYDKPLVFLFVHLVFDACSEKKETLELH